MKPAPGPNPCLGCGVTVKRSLPDRATCRDCRAAAWTYWRGKYGTLDPIAYGRQYAQDWGTVAGLAVTIRAARSELAVAVAV